MLFRSQAYPVSEIKNEQEKKLGPMINKGPYFASKSANYKLIFKPVLNLR